MKIEKVFVEFGGDPSDDKECYKRYTSTERFETSFPDSEVIEFVAKWKYDELQSKLAIAIEALEYYGDTKNYVAKWGIMSGQHPESSIDYDNGDTARNALQEIREKLK